MAISEAQNNIANQRSLVLRNPHGIGLFLHFGAVLNTPTRSPKNPETRINKGKNKENRIARGEPAGGPDGCAFVLGLRGKDAAGRWLVAVFSVVR